MDRIQLLRFVGMTIRSLTLTPKSLSLRSLFLDQSHRKGVVCEQRKNNRPYLHWSRSSSHRRALDLMGKQSSARREVRG